jgi:capsular exopolysaccharide synthesis family protein
VTEEHYQNSRNELSNLGIKDLFFKYIRFLPLFILSVALALFGAYVYLRYATPIYTSSGMLRVKEEKTMGGGDEKLNQLFLGDNTKNIQNEIEVLKSRPLMARVVNALNLQTSYFGVGKIKTPNIYKQCPFVLDVAQLNDSSRSFELHIKIVNENQFTINGEKPAYSFGQYFTTGYGKFRLLRNSNILSKEYIVTWNPTIQMASEYAASVQVSPKPNTGILSISLESANPQLCADIINQLMLEYAELTREEKNEQAQLTLHYINLELGVIEREIDSIQRIKVNYEITHNLVDPSAQGNKYFQDLTESDKGVFEQTLQLNVTGLIEDYLRDNKNQYNTVPSSLTIEDNTLSALIIDYNKNQATRKQYIDAAVPASNDLVKETETKIRQGRENILEAAKNVKSSISLSLNKLKQKAGQAEGQIKAMPAKMKEHAEITTRLQSKMGLYRFLMEKKEETSISLAAAIPSSKTIDNALANYNPVKPNSRTIKLLAIVIGLALPALLIFLLEMINDKITTRFDIEKITQAPVLGEVGHSFSENTLVVKKNNRGMVAEQFRIIRSNLQYVLNKIEKPVILVTSSFSGEGKSFVTTNLGAVMALAGKRTIVLEFDIRKPKILKGLGLPKGPGITNYLLGKVNKEDLPVAVPEHENLYVLSCGPVPPNPSELLLDQRVEELFAYLKENFDIVLIDTAPVGMVSDAMTLGRFANCTLYIVRQGHTYKKQIGLIDEFYREAKLPKVSIIINDVKVKPGYGYYGYGRYGYGYGYGYSSYYEEEKRSGNFFRRVFGWASSNGVKHKEGTEKQKQS